MIISPASSFTNIANIFINVVLPEPLGPKTAKDSPQCISKFTSESALEKP